MIDVLPHFKALDEVECFLENDFFAEVSLLNVGSLGVWSRVDSPHLKPCVLQHSDKRALPASEVDYGLHVFFLVVFLENSHKSGVWRHVTVTGVNDVVFLCRGLCLNWWICDSCRRIIGC